MNIKKYQLESYRKYLLNRVTSTPHIIEYIENCLATEDESAHHTFHKIMVHNWTAGDVALFETLAEYFSPSFVPVNYTSQSTISTFYTSSLSLVLKIIKLEFLFPHQRNMFNVDILFNDKTSADCFENRVKVSDIVAGVVSNRFNEKMELDLSNFCNDEEFLNKKINFYKLSLLSHFKILMLRMGRDTKVLNLSNNNLNQVPLDILNFFIKGDLIGINLSNNNIPSLQELKRVSSKIEKLWVEGNPLCQTFEPLPYVKQITMKFPRLTELDGIKLNPHVTLPFYRNFMITPDKKNKMLVDKFLSLYFAHYDSNPRRKIEMFYDVNCKLTINTGFTEAEEKELPAYAGHSRNIINAKKRSLTLFNNKLYYKRAAIRSVFCNNHFLPSVHDPSTFTVDVLRSDNKCLIIVVGGIYKELGQESTDPEKFFQFSRTFVFNVSSAHGRNKYYIINEMFSVSYASEEMKANCFKTDVRITNPWALHNPDHADTETVCNVFCHLTHLKKAEAEMRLEIYDYDLRKTLKAFMREMKENKISADKFIEEDDFSDTSSLMDEDID